MSEDRYFTKFPRITYNDKNVIDITRRVTFLNYVNKNPYLFYPYELQSNERADQFSDRYYEDQYKTWIVYLSNSITDPYYEWYVDSSSFEQFLIKKYGSFEAARDKVKYYENNWVGAEDITVSRYNSLPVNERKYWEPNYNNGNFIQTYKRRQIEVTFNTNALAKYDVANTSFIKDEICNIVLDANNVGVGQVVYTTDDSVYLQHLSGSYLSNTSTVSITESSYFYGTESNVNTALTSTTSITNNITAGEESYWSPITYLQYETYNNEYNKTIRVLDKTYSKQIADNLESIFK